MGVVVDPAKAFLVCHGYKIDDELILWSEGVIGTLSDEQEELCKKIVLENVRPPRVFSSKEEALKAEVEELPKGKVKQMAAVRVCAKILDEAEDRGLILGLEDVWATMDYCVNSLLGEPYERVPPVGLRRFIDEKLKEVKRKRLWRS